MATTLDTETHVVEVDVTDDDAMSRAADDVVRHLGAPSVVVANARVAAGGPFETSAPDTWRRVIEVNLVGSAESFARSLRWMRSPHARCRSPRTWPACCGGCASAWTSSSTTIRSLW
ncbi:SDR family NAD(P)-dependent oxidoreductase [Streptomyces exfoliatus]|uniref:SDR family NAD(P)-dependent oxidoreductase n=1 Tax=Streptomyces exfoliatus TaxID=1905 RepID=UPI003C303C48